MEDWAEMVPERARPFDELFENTDDPVFVLDPFEDRILVANQAACAMLGYARDEMLATPVSHVHPGELPHLRELIERVLRDGQGSTIALTCRTKSGDFLPTEIALTAFDGGGRIFILALVQDRSDHRGRDPGD
jgi:PAS domain S-box-containing protein